VFVGIWLCNPYGLADRIEIGYHDVVTARMWERSPRRPDFATSSNELEFPVRFRSHHKPVMMHDLATVEMKKAQKNVSDYLAEIGRRGGLTSRRELTKSHARQMVAIREMKRAAMKAGKPWPPRNGKLLTLS
jgi:hypothetical protein